MTVTHTISKTQARVGETITLSTSTIQEPAYGVMWIINYTTSDNQKSFATLRMQGRYFASYTNPLSKSITIDQSHLEIKTLTPICWSIPEVNAELMGIAQGNPIENNEYVEIGETYKVTFYASLAESIYSLGEKLATNISEKGVSASADDGLTTLANKIPEKVVIQSNSRSTSFEEIPVDVRVPQNVTSLSNNCFGTGDNSNWGALNLRKIELPTQLSSIGKNAFSGCANLEKIKFTNPIPPTVDGTTFQSLPTNCIIEVPHSYINVYKSTEYFPNPKFYHYKESVSSSNIGFFHNESNWNNNPKINLNQEKITTNDMVWLNSEFTTSQSYILTFDVICTKQDNNGILLFRNPSQSLNDSGYYIYSANSKTYVFDGETTSQMNNEYLNYGIHRVKIDCLNNSASIEIDGEIIIGNIDVSDLSNTIGLKASNSGNISISNIDLIEYECIFHDKCNSSSNLSNYGSAVFIAGDSSKNCKLTYNSSGQYYNFGPPSAGSNQSFIPINLLNNKSTSFKIIMKYYSGYNSIGFIAYTDTSNYCTFDYISQRNSFTYTNKINGSISQNSIGLGRQNYTTEIIPATIEFHVDMENMNMKGIGRWKNDFREHTIGQIPSNATKFGLYCFPASTNATYGLGNIYDIKIIQV